METMIGVLLLITIGSRSLSDAAQVKDIYGGKGADDSNGGKIVSGIQYTNNLGSGGQYVLSSGSQPRPQKYQVAYVSPPAQNGPFDPVPYPGVFHYVSKFGPIQYALQGAHQSGQQQPIKMIVTSYRPGPPAPPNQKIPVPLYYMQPTTQAGPLVSFQKYAPAPHNVIVPATQPVVHMSMQHHQPDHQQHSAYIPLSQSMLQQHHRHHVQHQYQNPEAAASASISAIPSSQQSYIPTSAVPHHHQQQQRDEQYAVLDAPQSSTVLTRHPPPHHHQQFLHAHVSGNHPSAYTYSIQPSLQIAASKQIVAPASPTPQYRQEAYPTQQQQQHQQYSSGDDGTLASGYLSLLRQYSMDPTSATKSTASHQQQQQQQPQQQQQQFYYQTPSTAAHSTAKTYLTAVQPTDSGTQADYSSAASVQYGSHLYHQSAAGAGRKSSSLSLSKYIK